MDIYPTAGVGSVFVHHLNKAHMHVNRYHYTPGMCLHNYRCVFDWLPTIRAGVMV